MSGNVFLVAVWMLFASLVLGGLYAWDKRAASRGRHRIPERTLLGIAAVGGWPGGMLASGWLRHKTAKKTYRLKFFLAVAFHLVATGALAYWLVG